MAETAGEKTLAPTEKRLKDATKNGDVLRSRDLGVAGAIVVGAGVLKGAWPWLFTAMERAMRIGLTWNRADIDDFEPGRMMFTLGMLALPPILLVGGAIIAMTLIAQLGITGPGRFNFGATMPKAERLNPGAGLGRMFGSQGWIEVAKGLLKISLLGGIAWVWARGRLVGLVALGRASLAGQLAYGWQAMIALLFALAGGLTAIATIDFPVQWIRRRRLRMSLQEAKDEHKEADGSPENKARQRQRQRAIAMGSIASAMKKAQFVVTNPTHFAIAMTYDPELAPAPVVLAKGRGETALAIRELAADKDIPCLEFPVLARALYYTTQPNQMIREELFIAVAGVLAFVLSLKRGEIWPTPAIEVPVELRFDAEGRPDPEDLAGDAIDETDAPAGPRLNLRPSP